MLQAANFPLPSSWQTLLSLYGFLLPFMLYAAWSTLAFWDIGRRAELRRGAAVAWIAVVLLVPFVGAMAYHVAGGSRIPGYLRAAVVGGGLGVYALVLAIGSAGGAI